MLLRAVAEKKEVEETKFRRDIFYLKAGKTWIDKSEYHKVKEVADYMKEHPNCTVEVTGYADRGTGNPKINNNLSQRRAQAVANMLIRNYGIKKNRISRSLRRLRTVLQSLFVTKLLRAILNSF